MCRVKHRRVEHCRAQDFNTDVHTAPNPQNAARAEANAALDARDYARAERLLKGLLLTSPADAVLLYDLGSAEDAQEETAAAEREYRAAITANAKILEPRSRLACCWRVRINELRLVSSLPRRLRCRAFRQQAGMTP